MTGRKAEAVAESRIGPPDRELLAASRLAGICPVCQRPIEGGGYGTGRLADGLFDSLDCVAIYWYPARLSTGDKAHERDQAPIPLEEQ